jgi:hypothetical protein
MMKQLEKQLECEIEQLIPLGQEQDEKDDKSTIDIPDEIKRRKDRLTKTENSTIPKLYSQKGCLNPFFGSENLIFFTLLNYCKSDRLLDSVNAYVIISWLFWVPNTIIAESIIQSPKHVQAR